MIRKGAHARMQPSTWAGHIARQLLLGMEAAYDAAGETMACNMMDAAALEGVQAFIEKRKPRW